jgi:hypothetical protein
LFSLCLRYAKAGGDGSFKELIGDTFDACCARLVGNGDAPESMNENADAPESILVKYGVQTEAQNAEQGAPKKDELVGAADAEANDQDEKHKDNILSEILLAEIDDQGEKRDMEELWLLLHPWLILLVLR